MAARLGTVIYWFSAAAALVCAVLLAAALVSALNVRTERESLRPLLTPQVSAIIVRLHNGGYSDKDIADYLSETKATGGGIAAARAAGYPDADIFAALGLDPFFNLADPRDLPIEAVYPRLPAYRHAALFVELPLLAVVFLAAGWASRYVLSGERDPRLFRLTRK